MSILKHNWNFFHPYERLFILSVNTTHPVFYYYKDQIVYDLALADTVVKIEGEWHPLEKKALKKGNGKIIATLPAAAEFLTKSQVELQRTDWMVIRELEKMLPEDNELRVMRDKLRSNVDIETNFKPEALDIELWKELTEVDSDLTLDSDGEI